MRQAWRKVLLVLVCCVLAVAGWIGLLNLAEVVAAARSYRSSPADLRAAADAAVLPAADPAFSGSGEYTEPLEPIIGKFVSYIPGTLPAEAPQISASTSENVQTFIVNTSSGYFHLASCYHVRQIDYANRSSYTGTRAEAAALYTPCKDCNP